LFPALFMLVSILTDCLLLRVEAIYSTETSVQLQRDYTGDRFSIIRKRLSYCVIIFEHRQFYI
jgi:hypothetical protein